MGEENSYYRKTGKELFSELDTGENGLDSREAKERLQEHGKNELKTKKGIPRWRLFLQQFSDVLMILLLVASVMSFIIQNYRDGIVMLTIAIVNGIIGFFQEHKAEQIMATLDKLVNSPARVMRDGKASEIPQIDLVPGDIVLLEEGDKVPADLRILKSFNLRTNDVSLTGESMPQEKHSNQIEEEKPLADRDNMAYLGTNVASGTARGVVVRTGMDTEMGKIAAMTQEEEKTRSPLQQELTVVANRIAVFAVIVGFFLFAGSLYQGRGLNFALIYGLGIAVAVVPQALPMQVTYALSRGVNRMAEKNAVVKKLASVETLGSTNVISTDKTGTLTKNEMTVKHVWFDGDEYDITGLGYEPEGEIRDKEGNPLSQEKIDELEIMFDASTMASNAEIHPPDEDHDGWYPIGDPTEAALITLSTKLGTRSPKEDEENPELHEFSFDSDRKRMSSIRQFEDERILTMKGALSSVLSISEYIYRDGEKVEITEEDKQQLEELNDKYSREALRVLAIAYRKLGPEEEDYVIEEIERDVVFLGLVAMYDPPKEGVKEAIAASHDAEISTFIMTGDHSVTARAIGEEIGISSNDEELPVFDSRELGELPDEELKQVMRENKSIIFSRVSPEDKLRIVKNLKQMDQVVAVTGDGVNDAPALKSAHIGVAMGQMGTDVSKEASELILLDDSYPTLVHAIKEGRTIYNNLKKTVLASLTSNGGELFIVLLGMLAGALYDWAIPILTIQILSIDLLAEILPLTAFTYDPASETLMTSPPREQDEHIVNKFSFMEVLFLGLLMGGLGFANFARFSSAAGGIFSGSHALFAQASTISYLTIVVCQWINIMSRRYETVSIFHPNFFSNREMLYSIGISIVMVLVVINIPVLGRYLEFTSVSFVDWLYVILAGGIFLFAHESIKLYKRRNRGLN
ncbi:MAG: cation-translocating P-type ATPase [Halanaerobiaceae bacterium]